MCAYHGLKKFNLWHPFIVYTVMIILGILSGISDIEILQNFGILISNIFIKVFKCISLPIIALSIIVTLAGYNSEDSAKSVWQRTIFYTFTTTIFAATISCLLYLLIGPINIMGDVKAQTVAASKTSYGQHLMGLIPSNIFSPFLEHQVFGVLLVGILLGIAIRHIPEEKPRDITINFFKGIHGIFLTITKWVVSLIPLGLYGFITSSVVQLRSGIDAKGIGEYLAIIIGANLVQGFIILPLWLKINHIKPFKAMRGMLPALSLAFFSKSSAGTLPVTMETVEKNLGLDPKISRFVLPLCTTINMNGCAAFIFTTVIYLMQNHGIEISLGTMVLWIFIATIAAVGNAGVPMGCFFLSASLLTSMDIPITLLGLILPFYSIIDMIETSLNVWSDSCVAQVVDKKISDQITS